MHRYGNSLALMGRLLLCSIFLLSGVGKIMDWPGTQRYMSSEGMPAVPVFLALAILFEIGGGLSLLAGWKARLGALALIVFLIPTTLIFHDFWTYAGQARQMQMINFLKNLAIIGGLAQVTAFGAGRFSLDARPTEAREIPIYRRPAA